ncbi:TRAP transporter small permease [Devosia nitrariae]|uniref:TRAP transporter small permease protein n=1 Tax=Devosia nitrariae TaxID=2071872 RepID=A0ABQ5W4R1_9HYPH|nr:TRAP transporter small permease subunit [Devosia nitrariae]GLQ54779.1 C4-dicarboxylate ABC transporter [Devosia nitrariae]
MTADHGEPQSPLERAYFALGRAEAVLAAVLLVAMVVLIFSGGVARMLRHPINWTTDFATCFFAWAAFLAADIAWRNDALMNIDLLTARLPQGWRRGVEMFNHLIILTFLGFLVYAGVQLAWVSSARSFQGIPWISYSWITMSLPVGAALLALTTLVRMRRGSDSRETA